MDGTDLDDAITATRAQLAKLNADFSALVDMTVLEYSLDTGQTVERVKRNEIDKILKAISSLENRLATLCARRSGSASIRVFPVVNP